MPTQQKIKAYDTQIGQTIVVAGNNRTIRAIFRYRNHNYPALPAVVQIQHDDGDGINEILTAGAEDNVYILVADQVYTLEGTRDEFRQFISTITNGSSFADRQVVALIEQFEVEQ